MATSARGTRDEEGEGGQLGVNMSDDMADGIGEAVTNEKDRVKE